MKGTVVNTAGQGTIGSALAEPGSSVAVAPGHARCGAAHAAGSVILENATCPGGIGGRVGRIVPAALLARVEGGEAVLARAVRADAGRGARGGPPQGLGPGDRGAARMAAFKIVGARYDPR